MREHRTNPLTALGAVMLAGGLGLAACDQTDTRVDRARDLADAALEQLSGSGSDGASSGMEAVSQDARAIAGEIQASVVFETAATPSRFAVGSIICKPYDAPEPEAMLEAEEPMAVGELPTLALDPENPETEAEIAAQTAPVLERAEAADAQAAPLSGTRIRRAALGGPAAPAFADDADPAEAVDLPSPEEALAEAGLAEPGEAAEEAQAAIEERAAQAREQMKLARRAVVTPRAIEAQTDAHSRMLDAMAQYGLTGAVELSPTGQMIIQLGSDGADPTQFAPPPLGERPPLPDLPQLAYDSDEGCPENVSPEAVRRNPVLATACVIEALRASGDFAYVEKDYIVEHQFARRPDNAVIAPAATRPNDPLFDLQWHFQNNGANAGESAGGAGFADFWTRQGVQGSPNVTVAVVDTGLQLDHPDIRNSPNIMPGWDMVSDPRMGNDGDGRDPDPNDPGDLCDPNAPGAEDSYHGTHVAGTIGAAATNNGAGVAGGAWDVKLVPVRALGKCGGRLSDINDAIRWAGGLIPAFDEQGGEVWNDNPADIINLSIGLFQFCPASLQDAIDDVTERGAIVVAAAGNARVSTRFYAPGGCNNVISVAASDGKGEIAPYSNFGVEVDVLAPGGDLTQDVDQDGRPDGVLSTKLAANCRDPLTGESVGSCYYAYEQGTSMAAPHVSAALALLMARFPDKTPSELEAVLLGALSPRASVQCAGACDQFPGAEPIEGEDGLCARPCGGGLLNLANINTE